LSSRREGGRGKEREEDGERERATKLPKNPYWPVQNSAAPV